MPVVAILAAYCIGSVPFAWLLARRWGANDLRRIGSGNLGAANVLRASGVTAGLLVAVLDVTKGAASVIVATRLANSGAAAAAAGLAAIVGHIYPVWLRFRGGKGVATLLGVVLALHWPIGLVYAVVWIAMLALLRISSLAGMTAAVTAPLSAAFFGRFDLVLLLLALALLVLWKHRANVDRLISGTEPRVGRKRG